MTQQGPKNSELRQSILHSIASNLDPPTCVELIINFEENGVYCIKPGSHELNHTLLVEANNVTLYGEGVQDPTVLVKKTKNTCGIRVTGNGFKMINIHMEDISDNEKSCLLKIDGNTSEVKHCQFKSLPKQNKTVVFDTIATGNSFHHNEVDHLVFAQQTQGSIFETDYTNLLHTANSEFKKKENNNDKRTEGLDQPEDAKQSGGVPLVINLEKGGVYHIKPGQHELNHALLVEVDNVTLYGEGTSDNPTVLVKTTETYGIRVTGNYFKMTNIHIKEYCPEGGDFPCLEVVGNDSEVSHCEFESRPGKIKTVAFTYMSRIAAYFGMPKNNKFHHNKVISNTKKAGDNVQFAYQENGHIYKNKINGMLAVFCCKETEVEENIIICLNNPTIFISLPSQRIYVKNNYLSTVYSKGHGPTIKLGQQFDEDITIYQSDIKENNRALDIQIRNNQIVRKRCAISLDCNVRDKRGSLLFVADIKGVQIMNNLINAEENYKEHKELNPLWLDLTPITGCFYKASGNEITKARFFPFENTADPE
eukprot:TCONS_00029041-protein